MFCNDEISKKINYSEDLTIAEVRQAIKNAEQSILNTLNSLEDLTSIKIRDVKFTPNYYVDGSQKIVSVQLEVDL